MNCLIENQYIRELSLQEKNTYVFPNELPNWKRTLKGKKREKKREKRVGVLYYGGGFIIVNRELTYFIAGGFINAIWTLMIVMALNLTGWHLQVRRCVWNRILVIVRDENWKPLFVQKKLHKQIHTQSISFCATKFFYSRLAWPRVQLIWGWVYWFGAVWDEYDETCVWYWRPYYTSNNLANHTPIN